MGRDGPQSSRVFRLSPLAACNSPVRNAHEWAESVKRVWEAARDENFAPLCVYGCFAPWATALTALLVQTLTMVIQALLQMSKYLPTQ